MIDELATPVAMDEIEASNEAVDNNSIVLVGKADNETGKDACASKVRDTEVDDDASRGVSEVFPVFE